MPAFVAARHPGSDLAGHRGEFGQKKDLLEFQMRELLAADVRRDEETDLRREREEMRTRRTLLARVCGDGESTLYSGEFATVARLGRLAFLTSRSWFRILPALTTVMELVDTARVQLEEAALQLRNQAPTDPL